MPESMFDNNAETQIKEETAENDSSNALVDLEPAAGQESQVNGAGGHVKVFDGRTGLNLNHNETTESDEETTERDAIDVLEDVVVPEEQAEQAKGGVRIGKLLGVN